MKVLRFRRYADPFRLAVKLMPGRIDMGVDYAVDRPTAILSPGPGVIVRLDEKSTWPGGRYIALKFTHGRYRGRVVYLAEHLDLSPGAKRSDRFDFKHDLHVGSRVHKNTTIAILLPGFPNCEIGWAKDAAPTYPPLAYGCYQEGDLTQAGMDFSRFLQDLGCRPGLVEGRKPTCPLPKGWRRS